MKSTIQKWFVDDSGNKVKAIGTVNNIRSASMDCEGCLTVEVEGISASGRHYMCVMSLKASDSHTVANAVFSQMPCWARSQLGSFGLGSVFNKKSKVHRYGVEIDSRHFFVIQTVNDLQNLCAFINN